MNSYVFILIISIAQLSLASYALSDDKPDEWSAYDDPRFSVRCSDGPIKHALGGVDSYEFIYIKWDGYDFIRQNYSAMIDKPHYWNNDESQLNLSGQDNGGKSSISASSTINESSGEIIIDMSLDASNESALKRYVADFFTHGSWQIRRNESGVATLKETTADFKDGQLTEGKSVLWNECRLMRDTGHNW